eukprot:1159813-Pelagomonas_calceolata.AAC.16
MVRHRISVISQHILWKEKYVRSERSSYYKDVTSIEEKRIPRVEALSNPRKSAQRLPSKVLLEPQRRTVLPQNTIMLERICLPELT